MKYEKVPVGKHHISMSKLIKPARWKQLWLEGSPKPVMMKLWFDRFLRFLPELEDFEDDVSVTSASTTVSTGKKSKA